LALPYIPAVSATCAPNVRNKKRRHGCMNGGVHEASKVQVTFHAIRNRRFLSEKLGPPSIGVVLSASRMSMRKTRAKYVEQSQDVLLDIETSEECPSRSLGHPSVFISTQAEISLQE